MLYVAYYFLVAVPVLSDLLVILIDSALPDNLGKAKELATDDKLLSTHNEKKIF